MLTSGLHSLETLSLSFSPYTFTHVMMPHQIHNRYFFLCNCASSLSQWWKYQYETIDRNRTLNILYKWKPYRTRNTVWKWFATKFIEHCIQSNGWPCIGIRYELRVERRRSKKKQYEFVHGTYFQSCFDRSCDFSFAECAIAHWLNARDTCNCNVLTSNFFCILLIAKWTISNTNTHAECQSVLNSTRKCTPIYSCISTRHTAHLTS